MQRRANSLRAEAQMGRHRQCRPCGADIVGRQAVRFLFTELAHHVIINIPLIIYFLAMLAAGGMRL